MVTKVMFSVLIVAAMCRAQGGAPSFSQSSGSPVPANGATLLDLALGDMNSDGKPDLVIGYDAACIEVIYQGTGGSFSTPGTALSGSPCGQVHHVAIADLNADGKRDVVAATQYTGAQIDTWFGGTGGFGSFASYTSGASTEADLVLFDADGDGDADVLLGDRLRMNNGSGAFGSETTLTATTATKPVATDLDGDGDVDVIGLDSDLETYMNNGSGSFSYGSIYYLGSGSRAMDAADLDLDGDQDVAVGVQAAYLTGLNNGSGTFTMGSVVSLPSGLFTTPSFNEIFHEVQLADINGDLYPDLVGPGADTTFSPETSHGTVVVGTGNGAGSFGNFTRYDGSTLVSTTSNITVWTSAVADMDGDLDKDIVYGEDKPTNTDVRVFLNTVNGGWTDLGYAKAGAGGFPLFKATGFLQSSFTLTLAKAKPSSPGLFFSKVSVGGPQSGGYASFKGGILVPSTASPGASSLVISTPSSGPLVGSGSNAVSTGSNTWVYMQYFIRETSSPEFWSASNALVDVVP